MSILRKLSWFFREEFRRYSLGVFALFVVAMVQLIPPIVIGWAVDAMAKGTLELFGLLFYLGALAFAAVFEYVFRYQWRTRIFGGAFKLEKTMRSRLFGHFLKMDSAFYQNNRTGDLMAHATNDLQAIQEVASRGVLALVDSMMTGFTTLAAMMIFIDWRLTILAILPLPLLALVSSLLGKKLHQAFKDFQETFSNMTDKVQESVTGMKAIKTFGREKEDTDDFDKKMADITKEGRRVNLFECLYDPLIILIVGLSYTLTLILGGYYVMSGILSLGQLVSFIAYIGNLVWPMFAIGMLFNVLQRGNASYTRVEELLAQEAKVVDSKNGKTAIAHGDFSMKINEFSYPDVSKANLHDIQIDLPQGKMLGLVGKTGAGKSTILKLLLREFNVENGEIVYGGENIQDLSMDSYLTLIGYVPQNHFLFSMSVADNIRFANVDASNEKVEKAAKMAAIHEDILHFSDQYETMVGERGVSLSGGQKQRISIARALMVDSELLILDDALSAVDAKTEEKILTNLKTIKKQTTIIAAHRLSSVMHADEILVMDKGTISERGTHEELLAEKGWYTEMWEMQQIEERSA